MKYAITGHTQGLGYAIANVVGDDNVVGFSRSTGYDIANKTDRQRIINESMKCDVFINNAHSGFAQTELLYELWDAWADTNKIIVNIGSNTTDGIKSYSHIYTAEKMSLEKASEQLSNQSKCKVVLLKFGWIGTDRILKNVNPPAYIEVDDAAWFVSDMISLNVKNRLTTATLLP